MTSKKILFITQYFDPEHFRGNEIAYHLGKIGCDVTVITGTPNYPKGKFFEGYGWFKKTKETKNGVKIIRVPIIPRGTSAIQLIANYFSYAIVSSFYMLFHLIRNSYDLCFVQQLSPVMISMPGVLFKKLTKKPMYLWVLDLWPESLRSGGGINNRYVLNFFKLFVKSQYKHAKKILVSSKDFEKSICQYGDYKEKIIYYPQWSDIAETTNVGKAEVELPDTFKVVFTGNVGEAQDFEHIVEAASKLKDEDNVTFIIIGDGRKSSWVKDQIEKKSLNNRIKMLGRFPTEYMSFFTDAADVLLATLKDEENFNMTVPAKIQTYMAAGKPIVAMMNGAGHNLINEVGCGVAVNAGNSSDLVDAILMLKRMTEEERTTIGRKGVEYYNRYFKKEECLKNLETILKVKD